MLPEIVFALAMLTFFGKIHFGLGTKAVVIGHVVWDSAFATLILQARVSALDPVLEDAAADLGSSPWRVFRRVTLPGLAPGIVAAGLLAFTFSTDDIVTSYFLIGGSRSPLPIVILSMIRFEVTPAINAIGMMLMVLTIGLFATGFFVLGRFGRGGRRTLASTLEQ
jgi:ABC-type spermidine/putrescine transport system permease subunit II